MSRDFSSYTHDELANTAAILKKAAALNPAVWNLPEARALAAEMLRRAKETNANPDPPLRVTVVDYGARK